GRQPGKLRPDAAEAIGAESSGRNERLIHERPLMRVLGILPAKGGEELARLDLELRRQRNRLEVSLLEFDLGLVVLVQLEDDIAVAFEIRIHRAIQRDF